jgi:hypothetical protein
MELTMREAKQAMFQRAGIPADGGDSEAWVDFKLGPVPMPFPNTDARRRAVKLHDLHHVLTGYRTDIIGEFEISAWEIASGCGRFAVPWGLNLMGLTAGLLVAPRRTMRAFWRGARSSSLYTTLTHDEVIDLPVTEVGRRLTLPPPDASNTPTAGQVFQLVAAAMGGLVLSSLLLVFILTPVTPVLWAWTYAGYLRDKARREVKGRARPVA